MDMATRQLEAKTRAMGKSDDSIRQELAEQRSEAQQFRRAEAEAVLEVDRVRQGLPDLHGHAGRLAQRQEEAARVQREQEEYWD